MSLNYDQKREIISDLSDQSRWERTDNERKPPERYSHVVVFNKAVANDIGISETNLQNSVKLVVAMELGIEPNIKAFNELDPDKTLAFLAEKMVDEYDSNWDGPEQWRPKLKKDIGDISPLQKE